MSRGASGPRFTFFGGKGGVGKTTCAAAAAVRVASEGARVLVVSTDPAHSLSDALGLELRAEPRRVRDAAGELYAAELDADKALTRWLAEREEAIRTIADRGTYLDAEDIDRFLSLSFPGVDELVGLVELMRLARSRPFDNVVVDTAPTGHTLRLLEMPDTLKRLSEVLDEMHAKHRFLASSLGGAWRPDFADETIAEIEQEARSLRELLSDSTRASFSWVTLPEELPVRESEDGVRAITALGIDVRVVIVNRVWPEPDRSCGLCEPRASSEHRWRKYVARAFADQEVLEVPARLEEPRRPAELLELASSVRRLDVGPKPARRPAAGPPARAAAPTARLQGVDAPIGRSVRLVLFGGKGGVGKTTTAAAAAIELARARRRDRVLVLSIDPAHSLADVLDTELSDEPRPVPGASPNLVARELDAARAWEIERDRYRQGIEDLFGSLFTGRMEAAFDRAVLENLVDLAPPGIDELLALVTILDALVGTAKAPSAGAYDLVIVDTAPSGHTLRLLALPEKALEWVHALMSVILKYRSVVGLGELASDLTQLARRLRVLIALLADPKRSAFVIVTRPGILPRLETERLAGDLRRLKVPIAAIVANGVIEPSCSRCEAEAALQRRELELLGRLCWRAARSPHLLSAPAVHPGPRGAPALGRWRNAWSERPAPRRPPPT